MGGPRVRTIALAALLLASASTAVLAKVAGARGATDRATTATSVGPGPVATTLTRDGYRLQLALNPNKPLVAGMVSLRLARHGTPVSNAQVRITFTMVGMGGLTGRLPQTAAGLYNHRGPILGMSGRWNIRLDITPRHAARFSVILVDRLGT